MEIEIEHLKTNENIVIMKLKDYKNLKESTNTFYKCWREQEKRTNKAIKYIENTYSEVKNEDGSLPLTLHDQNILEILKGSDN